VNSIPELVGKWAPEFYQYGDKRISQMPLDIDNAPLSGRRTGTATMPGLIAQSPAPTAQCDQDRLIHLQLEESRLSSGDVVSCESNRRTFYSTPGTITAALRRYGAINKHLHDETLERDGSTRWAFWPDAIRDKLTLLLSGPMQFVLTASGARHISSLFLAGPGPGELRRIICQVELQADDRLLCSDLPAGWESALRNASPSIDRLNDGG
jgi:hypothetical protein